jgi:hypothetical protein
MCGRIHCNARRGSNKKHCGYHGVMVEKAGEPILRSARQPAKRWWGLTHIMAARK